MDTSHYQREAALHTYIYHQHQFHLQKVRLQQHQCLNAAFSAFPVMDNSNYHQPPMTTSLNQQHYNTQSAGFHTMTPYNHQGPVMGTHLHIQQQSHTQYAGYANWTAPVSRGAATGATCSSDSQNLNVQNPTAPPLPTSIYQAPVAGRLSNPQNPGLNRPVPAVTTAVTDNTAPACINPALLMIPRTASPRKQPVTIDLTGGEDRSEVSTDGALAVSSPHPATAGSQPSPSPPPPAELPKESTRPREATPPTTATATPPSTSPTPAPVKPISFKRNYAWLQPTALLPDMPNSKKQKMSALEGAYRQRYETRAQNSTAAHFLGLKPVEGAPVVNWSKDVLTPSSTSSSGEPTSSPAKKKGKKEGGEKMGGGKVATSRAKVATTVTRKEQQQRKMREKKKAWRNGEEAAVDAAAAAAAQAEADEDAVVAREIEAMYEEEEEEEDERERREKEEADEMAAEIEAMFDEEEEKKEREKREKEEADEMAAEIEAMFDEEGEESGEKGDEEEEEDNRTLEEMSRYLLPAEEERPPGADELIIEDLQSGRG